MKTQFRTDITVGDICQGFYYNTHEGKGLNGWGGKLVIQPEYQRNYIYANGKDDVAVVDSLLKKYPIGLIYFLKVGEDKYEVLDGQQRITSFGRFVTGQLDVLDTNGMPHKFDPALHGWLLKTPLTIYICEGEGDAPEAEIKAWFKTINIAGKPLNEQELLNATYSGPFVTVAKAVFSNSSNSNRQKWAAYVKGDLKRQAILAEALRWVSKGNVEEYLKDHRYDTEITELQTYFDSVIAWADSVFKERRDEMCGLDWGRLYETYHCRPYNPEQVQKRIDALFADADDGKIKQKANIFEYVLGGESDPKLLKVRIFSPEIARKVYKRQTDEAKVKGISNCPLCAVGHVANTTRLYDFTEMEADHVTAWSRGGDTSEANCQMLCRTHNRAKGNC
ncbi:MAG: DUF262 domain-containing protein [Kiritimatiellae bacterium]|nr:DUF262 domain-containing protein [Kiritimatiellia bacterium]